MIEEGLEHACLAQPVEALPHAVPLAEPLRQRPPGDVVAGKVVQCFEKKPIVATLVAAPRQGSSKHLQCHRPIRFRHHRGHRRPPNQSAAHESDKVTLGNPQTDTCGNPSTPPNRNGLRWRDAPQEYGPHKTLYNRWKRWGEMGVFGRMME